METTRTIDELLEQTAWVRRLARSMVSDAAAAEDLAQEAMLVALRKPPPSEVPLRAWLLGVLRNIAASWRRRDLRRAVREELAEPEVTAASTDELVGQVEVERHLAAEVLKLSEPFRRTVLLRYFQGLSSAEIARQTGTPEGTVRWRLKRGLDELREAMDARHGGRRAWVVALLPGLRGGSAPAASATAAGALSWWSLLVHPLALLVVGLCAALLVLFGPRARDAARPAELPALAPDLAGSEQPGARHAPLAGGSSWGESAALPPPERSAASAARPLVEVRARVLDVEGRPVAGALLLASAGGAAAQTDRDGRAVLALEAPEEEGEMLALVLAREGHATREVPARWRGERVLELGDLAVRAASRLVGAVIGPDGQPCAAAEVLVERLPPAPAMRDRPLELRAYFGSQLSSEVEVVRCDADGRFVVPDLAPGYARVWARAPGCIAAWSEPLELRARAEVLVPLLRLRGPEPGERIVGHVLDPEGGPVAGARVEALRVGLGRPHFSSHISAFETVSAEDGSFELILNPRPTVMVAARDPEGRWNDAVPRRSRGGARDLGLELLPRITCILRARSAEGQPIESFELQVLDGASGQRLLGPIRGDPETGELRFDVPTGPFVLRVSSRGQETIDLGPFAAEELGELVEVTLAGPGRHRGRVLFRGAPVAGAMARFHETTEDGEWRACVGLAVGAEPLAALVKPNRVEFETDAEGRFVTARPLPERFFVRVDHGPVSGAMFGPLAREALAAEDELLLELPEPGELSGVVLTDPGASPAGVLVGVTNGSGRLFVERADAAGSFHFEGLAPGRWQVRALERDLSLADEVNVLFDEIATRDEPIRWDAVVAAGERAHATIDLRAESRAWIEGRVLLGRRAPGPWLAKLSPADLESKVEPKGARSQTVETWIDAEGRFRFDLGREGRYALEITHFDEARPAARIEDVLTDERGGTRWSYEVETAVVTLRPPPGGSVPGARLTYVHEHPGGAVYFAAIERDGQDGARPIEVPAGRARVVPHEFSHARRDSATCFEVSVEPDQSIEPRMPADALGGF